LSRTINPNIQDRLTILVAEDNPLNSRLLEARLVREGHDVVAVANGQACLDTVKARPQEFDAIFMDLQVFTVRSYRLPSVLILSSSILPRQN